ncbi:MAG: hypothetical protein RTU63_03025, partial [Candidatus Thorarchaeota archaeon]
YYRDEKCKEIEKILQNDSKYAECEVKRVQWGDTNTNPFDVLDENEESIVLLETWEVNTLSASEILLYIEVKQKLDRPLSDRDAALYGSSIALGLSTGIFAFLHIFEETVIYLAFMIIPIFILTPILGIISIRTYRESIIQKKNADLEAARKDSSFLDILRRLSELPEVDKYTKKKFAKRIKNIEDGLAGRNS